MRTYWLSFVEPDRPRGERFLGVVVIEAEGVADAVARSWATGCNPGGQVATIDLDAVAGRSTERRLRLAEALSRTPQATLLGHRQLVELGWVTPTSPAAPGSTERRIRRCRNGDRA